MNNSTVFNDKLLAKQATAKQATAKKALRVHLLIATLAATPLALAQSGPEAAEVEVSQPAPNVQVQQPAPNVSVEPREAKVDVQTDKPQVSIEQSKPEVTVDQPEPEIKIDQAEPKVVVNGAEPTVEIVKEEPEVEVIKAEPEINVVRQNAEGDSKLSAVEQKSQQTLMSSELSELNGKELYNADGKQIGEINEVVTRKSDNAIGFIVPVGGLLGIGATDIFIPAEETQLMGDKLQWSKAQSPDSLKEKQGIDRNNFEAVSSDYKTLDDAYDASLVAQ